MFFLIPFSSHALTSKTTNIIHGSAPYLTFDGGRTRVVNTDDLLGISLSDGTQYTPSTNTSSKTPIELPDVGQSFADINMLVPPNTDSITLSKLIESPYNYWGDDDGDDDITATGSLHLSIVDRNKQAVSRDTVLTICNAPYQVKLSSTKGTLTTRYGVPQSRTFSESKVTYYVSPKAVPVVCFAKPELDDGFDEYAGPASIWNPNKGFLPQSFESSSYGLNFPTTGANNLYFDLNIRGINEALSWAPVSHGGITATMTNSKRTSVRVTLTGPVASSSQWASNSPGSIAIPTLPQIFELIGRDSQGNEVVKYGFELKQWFVNRGTSYYDYSNTLSWCNSLGYRMPKVKDLTNASCQGADSSPNLCQGVVGATPPSLNNHYQRRIGAGLFTEWGDTTTYASANFINHWYGTSDLYDSSKQSVFFVVSAVDGMVVNSNAGGTGICVSP